jgi:hypothetical protein
VRRAAPSPASHSLRDLSRGAGEVYGTAALRSLLVDCLVLWGVAGRVTGDHDCVTVVTDEGAFSLRSASTDLRPVRWFLQTPERAIANRPPRALPSIVALLSALRNTLGGEAGVRLRVGSF